MAISYIGGSVNNSAGTTSITTAVPGSLAANDVAFVFVSANNNPTLANGGGGTNDLTLERQDSYAAAGAKGGMFYRRLDGSETGNFTVSWTGSQRASIACVVLRGVVASGTPFDVAPIALTTGSGVTPQGASITTVTANAWIIGAAMVDTASAVTWGVPSGWNNRQSSTTNQGIILADQVFASPGASGTFDFSVTSNTWAVYGAAIQPAAGATGNPWYAYAQMRERLRNRDWQKRGLIWTPAHALAQAA